LLVYLLAKCHIYSQFYVQPLDLCSACLVVLQCQQPCMTRSMVEFPAACHVQVTVYVCWHTSVCTRSGTRLYLSRFCTLLTSVPAVLCYVQLTQTNCWYHGPARPALDSFGFSGSTGWNDMLAHLRNLDLSLKWL